MPISVALAVTGEIPILEVAAPCEIFGVNRTDLADPWYDFTVCGSDSAHIGGWFRPEGSRSLDGLVRAHTVVVPAYRDVTRKPPADLVDAVRAAHEAGARVVSICTGAFVLAAAGLLDGRRATTHWLHTDLLAARYPEVKVDPSVLYIDEGSVLTSAGKAAGIDLCLHLVRLDHGAAVANALARRLVMPPYRDGGQAQFITPPVSSGRDHALAELLPWVTARLDKPLTVVDLARRARMSTRNLTRHFNAVTGTTPLQWLLTQRIYKAQVLLETSDCSIEQIAAQTGMGTAATLRRHFNRAVGVPPDTYRRTFHAEPRAADPVVPSRWLPVRFDTYPRTARPAALIHP
ncbi:helix-turn-helix domain-containing protein [Kitasatospora sp. NPDC057223]|uniref:helix-turn-helix domain-containing protein n=1 Tax=Kitasatospora sp. NPDC057223 TaxID=3346055 RepID=UPI00362F1741